MRLIKGYLVLILLCLSVLLYVLAMWLSVPLELAVLSASVLSFLVAWVCERVLPYRPEWNLNQGDLSADILSAGIIIGLADPLMKAVAPVLVLWFYASLNIDAVMTATPFWLEVVLVLLLVEFGKYWSHRLHHQLSSLWCLHAMHHSSERLYVLNGLRFHPLNYVFNFVMAVLPAMLLGFSPEAILAYLAFTQPVVLIQHANINLRHGWLNWVFSTPEVHRWHHSTVPDEANRNFGNALLLWDHVFGTFKPAEGFDESKQAGLFLPSKAAYPGHSGYFNQLLYMFKKDCCRS